MSIRTYSDKNFFHNLAVEPDDQVKKAVVRQFSSRRYSLYVSGELVEEALGLLETKRVERLPAEAGILLETMNGRAFKYYGDLVIEELRYGSTRPLLDSRLTGNIKATLQALARGYAPADVLPIPAASRQRKQNDVENWEKAQKTFQEGLKAIPLERPPHMTFEQFKAQHWAQWVPGLLADIAKKGEIIGAEDRIKEIVAGTTKYPYANAAMRTHMADFYRHTVLGYAVEKGDTYDVQQIVYLGGMNLLLTNDRKMRELCGWVYGAQVKVLSYAEFVEEIGVKGSGSAPNGRTISSGV